MGGVIPVLADFLTAIFSNKIIAYFVVLGLFALDGFGGVALGFNGFIGTGISVVLQTVTNNPNIVITSWQLMVLIAILPIIRIAIDKSGK